jgi:hypothetical protein
MARTIQEYFEERKEECKRLSLGPNTRPRYLVEDGSDERRGRILMTLHMTERATLEVSESVIVQGNYVHRRSYAYYLVIDGQEYWSRDYDSIHGYHGHTIGHKERIKASRVSFKEAAEQAWEIVGQEEELEDAG